MIIFLYGPDTYRSRKKLEEIIAAYKKVRKNGLNFFDAKLAEFEDFWREVATTSMFKEKKLIILTNLFSGKLFKEEFFKNKKEIAESEDTFVIFEEDKILAADSLFKYLKKNVKTQEFELLTGQKLNSWTKKETELSGAIIEKDALDELINFVGSDLWRLSNEIKKLAALKKGSKIEKKDVEKNVDANIETKIFQTIDAIASRSKGKALRLIMEHLEKGDRPAYLLAMINFQMRNILTVKELIEKGTPFYDILRITKLNQFVVKKSYEQANKFSFLEIKKIYRRLFEVDCDIKSGFIAADAALDLLIEESG
ncbi:MAG: DNA polymerase III subunit delta [Candidatus Parcubacteria bacterium]|nr:DNA polymerase III subunit delta [Candidatus Parcubacteria bacterium]